MYTLNCRGKAISIEKPLIMGILNYTDDSFFEGSRLASKDAVLQIAKCHAEEGADILDVGAQSTRPGSTRISAGEEISKLRELIPRLREETGLPISVDTYHAEVARAAVEAGADMINDISGGTMDPEMISTVAQLRVPYICMHIKGTPENMQEMTDYQDILKELLDYFIERIAICQAAGIRDIIIDPGFGFAKTIDQNLYLLKHLSIFSMLQKPILAGLSRKSTIYRTLGTTAGEALNGTTVLNTLALQNGAHILRVHDVRQAVEVKKLIERYQRAEAANAL